MKYKVNKTCQDIFSNKNKKCYYSKCNKAKGELSLWKAYKLVVSFVKGFRKMIFEI